MAQTGFRVLPMPARPSREMLAEFARLATTYVSDCMNRMPAGGAPLRAMHGGAKLCGPAFTVKTAPGDNLMVHKAIDTAQPGDVIVVDAGGDTHQAIIGEIMSRHARSRGIPGFVIDGAVRDSAFFASENFPTYARGATPRGPYKDGPGEINVPVAIAGMVVNPGDIVLGDEDGIVVVPLADAPAVLAAAQKKRDVEAATMKQIAAGTLDRRWVDESLKKLGCDGI